ncbi:hypothetical protein [Prevotella sp. TCVGH]|nr:hypothetical protein [Prevotella sp. TCVGH]
MTSKLGKVNKNCQVILGKYKQSVLDNYLHELVLLSTWVNNIEACRQWA